MRKRILRALLLGLLAAGLAGCGPCARGFWTGAAVTAAAACVWCDAGCRYVDPCCHPWGCD